MNKKTNLYTIENSVLTSVSENMTGHFKIPYFVAEIDRYTFANCTNLKTVEIPSSVTHIGDWSFGNCTNLKTVEIPSSVTYIGRYAFLDCDNLKTVEIPSSVKNIGIGAFLGCDNLKTVVIRNASLLEGKDYNDYFPPDTKVIVEEEKVKIRVITETKEDRIRNIKNRLEELRKRL